MALRPRPGNAGRGPLLARTAVLLAVVFALAIGLRRASEERAAGRAAPVRPNVLLVSIDSLRSDHLGAYGYTRDTSPTIDRLANDGVLFEEAISASSWTLPAHMSLLTATPPERHGVVRHDRRLRDEAVTLAEVLRDEGYVTAGFVAGPYLKDVYGYGQGFDVYDQSAVRDGIESHKGVTGPRLTELVLETLDRTHEEGAPFFVFLHMWDVHYDYNPPPPYDTMFDPEYDGPITGENFIHGAQYAPDMAARDLEHVLALYDGEIRYTDAHLGRILDRLQDKGLLDDTVVVVTSDHGEEFFEHGRKGHGDTLFDETIRVPLVIRYPRRIPPGQRIAEQVRLIDVAPTLLGLIGVERPASFGTEADEPHHARNLAPWIATPRQTAAFPRLLAHSHTAMGPNQKRSVRSLDRKLVLQSRRPDRPQLFDLRKDSGEQRNIAKQQLPRDARGLRREADRHQRLWGEDHLADPMEMDPTLLESLRALGYVQ